MAVEWVRQIQDDEDSTDAEGGPSDTLVYKVLCDSPADRPAVARQAVAARGDLYTDPTTGVVMEVKSVTARRDPDHPSLFLVTVSGQKRQQPDSSSDKWDCKFSSTGVTYTEVLHEAKDTDGNVVPVVNKAGCPFDPSIEKEYHDEQITVSFKTLTPPAAVDSARGKINAAACSFTIAGLTKSYAAKTLKLTTADYSHSTTEGGTVWDVSLVFMHRADGWNKKVLNAGFYERDDAGELVEILDKWGNPISAPVLLDEDGQELPEGDDPVYCEFVTEDPVDFAPLFAGLN